MKKVRQLTLFSNVATTSQSAEHHSERPLIALAIALGARDVAGWSMEEERLIVDLPAVSRPHVELLREQIRAGNDPLGDAFCNMRPPEERRKQGATYTPAPIIRAMVDWAARLPPPDRIVDPGIGSGRFALEAGRRFPRASILGVEIDPLPAILARANLAASGLASRARVILGDFRDANMPPIEGRTLYIGNPPYVRHHLLEPRWKRWLVDESLKLGLSASQLAGLHVYFFLATAAKASRRDFGVFITAAEWLDVNYGRLVRDLILGPLGGRRVVLIDPAAMPFPDAATTAAITTFRVGRPSKRIGLKRVESLANFQINGGMNKVHRERLEVESRWTHFTRSAKDRPIDFIELGELFRVHRGQVTGANKVWIEGVLSAGLPQSVFYPSITKAHELFHAGAVLEDASKLRRVIDLPIDLGGFARNERQAIEDFLNRAERLGARETYVAANRRAWWSVGLRQPAPILATYMARRPPAFVLNRAAARHINIAHGLYPRETLNETVLQGVVSVLARSTSIYSGRTYAGGLTKFEPREMERLLIPRPEILSRGDA